MAGGLLLLAIYNLLHPELPLRQPSGHLGVVPLGTPLIVGPAVLTTLLTLARSHGYALTLTSFVINLVLVWVTLRWASTIVRAIGEAGTQAMAKVFGLLLAAIGVTLIRRGLELTLRDSNAGFLLSS
jgi:multiple antibiotic resistance protein